MLFNKKNAFRGSSALKTEHELIQQYLANIDPDNKGRLDYFESLNPNIDIDQTRRLLRALYEKNEWIIDNSEALSNHWYDADDPSYKTYCKLQSLVFAVLKGDVFQHLPIDDLLAEEDFLLFLSQVRQHKLNVWKALDIIIQHVRAFAARGPVSQAVYEHAIAAYDRLEQSRELVLQQEELYFLCHEGDPPMLYVSDHWGEVVFEQLQALPSDLLTPWNRLLTLCHTAYVSKPSGRWNKEACSLIEDVGIEHFREMSGCWFALVGVKGGHANDHILSMRNQDMLRGLAWCAALVADRPLTRALGQLAKTCFRRTPVEEDGWQGYMQLSVPLGNAVVYALGTIATEVALTEIASLQLVANSKSARNAIAKALQNTANSLGISAEELEEVGVPTYGLDCVGEMKLEIDEFEASLTVDPASNVVVRWRDDKGNTQKTPPKKLIESNPEIVREFKQAKKDIEKMLPAQVARLERLFRSNRHWSFEQWNNLYCSHPLVGVLTRRLIWVFSLGNVHRSGMYANGVFLDSSDSEIEARFLEGCNVSLWHPLAEENPVIVKKWRQVILSKDIVQPFKQAHREVYPVSDVELADSYSLRFSNHILRQVVLRSLCDARHWNYTLRVINDGSYQPATLSLGDHGFRAEFFVDCVVDESECVGTTVELVSSCELGFFPVDAPKNHQTVWDRLLSTKPSHSRGSIPISSILNRPGFSGDSLVQITLP